MYWFCHISKWICHRYTCVPHPEPSSLLPPHTIPLDRPSAPAPSIQYCASNLDWRLVSYMILYIFQCHSPYIFICCWIHFSSILLILSSCSWGMLIFNCISLTFFELSCYHGIAELIKWIGKFLHLLYARIWRGLFFQSVQFSRSVVSNSLRTHEPQHVRPPCPSPTPGAHPSPCPLSQWCHPTISSSVVPFSSCPQSFPASGFFQMSQFFSSGGQSIGVSASTSVLPVNTQDWSPLGWTGWISLQPREFSRVFSNTTVQKHQFFCAQLYSVIVF